MLSRLKNSPVKDVLYKLNVTAVLVAMLAFLSAQSVLAVEVYSWVDADGTRHFSGQPPDHDNYELMTIRDRGASAIQRTESETEQVVSEQETIITTPDRTVTVVDPEIIAANCNRARNNIDLVNSRRRIVVTGEDGEPRRLDDDERANLTSESQAYIDENCQ